MSGTPNSETPRKKSRTGKPKAKSGCRTCKIRKLKCDESRPACHRCSSTGRICDGYGIWGGGGSVSGPKQSTAVLISTLPLSVLATSMEEKGHFEWFRCRTSSKLHPIFASSFWDTLVFQASFNEPAVLHAVLALSSAHKTEVRDSDSIRRKYDVPDKHDQFMLQQYSQAISHLLPYFSANDKASVRIALIACVIFICLECLRGRYKTAQAHLQNGLKLLTEIQPDSSKVDSSTLPCRDSVDDWIIESLFQIRMQAELLNQGHRPSLLLLPTSEHELLNATFQSTNQARIHLDQSLEEILYLTEQSRQHEISKHEGCALRLLDRQRRIQARLVSWFGTYEATSTSLLAQKPGRDTFAYQLLHIYYTMEGIMADTCLSLVNESIFDSHIDGFVSIMVQSIKAWKMSEKAAKAELGHSTDVGKWIADRGWIAPLYFTALKCRNHRVRLQAIKMLFSTTHREGIWDARIAACVARKVMEIEEKDFYKGVNTADDFYFLSAPENKNFLLPALPESYRLHEVQFMLPDGPQEKLTLRCKRKHDDGSWEAIVTECDLLPLQ